MKVIRSSRVIFVDVDETLILWDWKQFDPEGKDLIRIADPVGNFSQMLLPHQRHITLLKQFKTRGHTIVVWSQGGNHWAESVVKALDLEDHVDLVMDKPSWYIDDLPASAFMGNNIYLHPSDPTKDQKSWVVEDNNVKD